MSKETNANLFVSGCPQESKNQNTIQTYVREEDDEENIYKCPSFLSISDTVVETISVINDTQDTSGDQNNPAYFDNISDIPEHKKSFTFPKKSRSKCQLSSEGRKHSFSKTLVHDPNASLCLRTFCRGWLAVIRLFVALRAILVRIVFLIFTFASIVTVVKLKNDNGYWLLSLLTLPLLIDLCFSIGLVIAPRKGQAYVEKWFTKCLLAYLLCACPPIWIIELHHLKQLNDATDAVMQQVRSEPLTNQNPWLQNVDNYNAPNENLIIIGSSPENYLKGLYVQMKPMENISENMQHKRRVKRDITNEFEDSMSLPTAEESLLQAVTLQHYPLKMRIRIMEQLLLLSVIVGRWLLPRFGISRDQLSQLLLINIGNAADILELFEAFDEEAVRSNHFLKICILSLWQASLLQFCFNKTATIEPEPSTPSLSLSSLDGAAKTSKTPKSKSHPMFDHKYRSSSNLYICAKHPRVAKVSTSSCPDQADAGNSQFMQKKEEKYRRSFCCLSSTKCRCNSNVCFETELWAIIMSLLLQDMPFFCLRLTLLLHFNVRSYSHFFFTFKNTLLILLQVFRSGVICLEHYRKEKSKINTAISIAGVQ